VIGFVASEYDCSSSFLNAELRPALSLPIDDNDSDDICTKAGETDNEEVIVTDMTGGDRVVDQERCAAMLAAMDVSTVHSSQPRLGPTLSVEACLAKFTDRELLSGTNMITCDNCSHSAAAVDACTISDNSAVVSGGDGSTSMSSSKPSGSGTFDYCVSDIKIFFACGVRSEIFLLVVSCGTA